MTLTYADIRNYHGGCCCTDPWSSLWEEDEFSGFTLAGGDTHMRATITARLRDGSTLTEPIAIPCAEIPVPGCDQYAGTMMNLVKKYTTEAVSRLEDRVRSGSDSGKDKKEEH
ncbi:MAG TPA: hypothetical protein VJX30_03055 [Terriglobales bacterium]|nr:hypothetical protein [Terriglobales bacterium]